MGVRKKNREIEGETKYWELILELIKYFAFQILEYNKS